VAPVTGQVPESFALIAGKGVYPLLLARSARRQGVKRIFAIAFRHETDPAIGDLVDDIRWLPLGRFAAMLAALKESGMTCAVLAGLIAPTHLFRIQPDAKALALLRALPRKNAHTIFGAVAEELGRIGLHVLPASLFMEDHMPAAGVLSRRPPDPAERRDIELGLHVADLTSGLNIGQTVVVKDGTVLAVEAFEGTDETIRRGGRLGGPGAVVVKVAKRGHDMRFDIPAIGLTTLKELRKIKARALAVQEGRAILLERDKVVAAADRMGLCLTAVPVPSGAPQEKPDRVGKP